MMNSVNLIVDRADIEKIKNMVSSDFHIISMYDLSVQPGTRVYFHITTTEEEMLALILKYGPSNVWKR